MVSPRGLPLSALKSKRIFNFVRLKMPRYAILSAKGCFNFGNQCFYVKKNKQFSAKHMQRSVYLLLRLHQKFFYLRQNRHQILLSGAKISNITVLKLKAYISVEDNIYPQTSPAQLLARFSKNSGTAPSKYLFSLMFHSVFRRFSFKATAIINTAKGE